MFATSDYTYHIISERSHPMFTIPFDDAFALRRFIVTRYSRFLVDGGSLPTATRATRLVNRLAKLVGLPVDQVWADLKADAEIYLG